MCGKGSSSSYGSLPPQSMQTTTATPQATAMYQTAFQTAQQAAARPYTPYSYDPNAFVAPVNPQQQMAIGNINQVAQTGSPYFQAGAGLTGAAGTTFAPQIVGAYMNPYTQAVAAPTLGLLQQQQQQQLAQQQAEAIKAGAFGGERSALQRAYLQGQQGLAYGKTAGDIFSAGYQPAMGAAQADLQRQMLAGGQLGQLGVGASQAALAGAQAQLGAGTLQQQTQQAGLQALYNQFLQQQAYPFQTAQFLANTAAGLGPLYGGTTYTAQAQPYFSDPRLKDGVREMADGGGLGYGGPEPIGQTYDGQDIWRYSKFGQPEIGLMAPQVAQRNPDAVGEYAGYQTVDLPAATDQAAAMGRARMGGAVEEPGDYARGGYAGGGAALTTGDLAAILAAQQAMYGGLGGSGGGYGPSGPGIGGGAGLPIPKEGISAARSIHQPGGVTPLPSKSSQMLEGLKGLTSGAEGIGKLFELGKAGKDYLTLKSSPSQLSNRYGDASGGRVGYAVGGNADDDLVPERMDLPTGQLAAAQPIHQPSGGGSSSSKGKGGLGETLGDVASIGSSVATLAPYVKAGLSALMSFSDPRLKSGIRVGMQDGGDPIDRYLEALASGESGGSKDPYSVLGPQTKYGRPIGKYQILPTNVPQWASEAGLGRLTPEEFRGNREAQEAVARHKFGEYLGKTGNPEEAAAMWLAGPGYKKHMGARDVLGTSIPQYQARFRKAAGLDAGEPLALAAAEPSRPTGGASAAIERVAPTGGAPKGLAAAGEATDERGLGAAAPRGVEPSGISGFLRGTAPEGTGERALDFLTSEKFLVPALTGLAAMTASPSRYLGPAIMQGIGAGAQSYMDVMGKEADIAKRQAETEREKQMTATERQETRKRSAEVAEKLQDVYGKSIFQKGDMWFVRLANGATVSLYDWMKDPQPVWGGGAEGAPGAAGAPAAPGSEGGKPGEAAPAGAQKPIGLTPEDLLPPPSWMGWDNKSDLSAKNELRVLVSPASVAEKARGAEYRKNVEAAAEAAQAQKLQYNDIAEIISDIAHQTGMNAPGAGGTTRAMIVNYGNTVARMAGLGENYFGTSDTSSRLLEKLNTLAAERGVQAGQQTSLGALSQLISAQPNIDQPPKAATFNAASNMVNNQMKIDQRDHADVYGQRSGGIYSRAALDFKRVRTPAKYRKELDALQKTMWEKPDDFKAMVEGGSAPGAIEKYFMNNFNISGMSRYFGG